jgi:Fur family ferric uptake transcriptional regulator
MDCEKLESLKRNELKIALLLKSHGILSAKELQKKLKIDKATVYRNLKSLTKKDVVREIRNQEGIGFYELKCKIHNPIHPHFECKICKKIYCLKSLSPEDALSLSSYTNFEIENIDIKFTGICDKCKEKK